MFTVYGWKFLGYKVYTVQNKKGSNIPSYNFKIYVLILIGLCFSNKNTKFKLIVRKYILPRMVIRLKIIVFLHLLHRVSPEMKYFAETKW